MSSSSQNSPGELEIERERLAIEGARLKIEEKRADAEQRFVVKHLAEIIAAAIAFAGVLVSAASVWTASIQKDKELAQQQFEKNQERVQQVILEDKRLALEREKNVQADKTDDRNYEYKWRLDLVQFVERHQDDIFSNDPARIRRMQQVMLAAFPPEDVKDLFKRLEAAADSQAAKDIWRSGGTSAGAVSSAIGTVRPLPVRRWIPSQDDCRDFPLLNLDNIHSDSSDCKTGYSSDDGKWCAQRISGSFVAPADHRFSGCYSGFKDGPVTHGSITCNVSSDKSMLTYSVIHYTGSRTAHICGKTEKR